MESPLADDDDNDDLSDDTATLLSMLPGASVVVDEHDEVVRCNPAAYRLGVVSDDAIAQQHVLDAIHEARKSGGKRQFDLTTDTPERYVADQNKGDHVATQSVHRPNWLKVTVGRINEQFVIVLITDVSDVIRFAQVRDSFITNVSEQLLGPTEALAKLADSLESGNLDEQQVAADARRVRSSCSKLNHMVSDLLLLIRAQEPITPSSANRLNVMEQLRATAARLEPQAAEAGVQLNIKGDDDLVINGEADQIDSAVTKLIENAIGYSKENGVVSVSASKDKDGDRAVIRVIDQGTGIAKKDQARIFERFYRVDKMLDLSAVDQARCGQTDYEQMDIASYSRKNFGMFAGEETTVQLLCDTSMTGVIIDRFGASVAMRPYDETHILARAQVAVSPQFFGWLAGLSTHIRVISPDSVVNKYQIFLQEILRSYTDMQ